MKRVLITGVGGPAGVNFVKSLRDAPEKFRLVGTDMNRYHLNFPEINRGILVEKKSDSEYIERLNKIISEEGIELVHPQPDPEVKTLSENRKKLDAKVFLPERGVIDVCQNKLKSAEAWSRGGIKIAKTMVLESEDDVEKAAKELGLPFWIRATVGAGARGSTPVDNIETGKAWLGYWRGRGMDWKFIAQEMLPGRNIAFQSIWRDGELVCSQARERLEYIYPYLAPSGITGTPSVAVTVSDEQVNEIATKCVEVLDKKATGVFCIDLKENKDGIPCPTEINVGRFFTTSFGFASLGKALGRMYANMPYLYVKLAYGEDVGEVPKYNALPKDWYYVRHIDCGAHWVRFGKGGEVLEKKDVI